MSILEAIKKPFFVAFIYYFNILTPDGMTSHARTNKTLFFILIEWTFRSSHRVSLKSGPAAASISDVKQTALHLSLSSHQRQIKTPLVKTKFSNYLDTVELTRI